VFWQFIVIFYVVIICWVLLFVIKVSRTSAALPEIKQEDTPFILSSDNHPAFASDIPFLISQNIEKEKIKNMDIKMSGVIPVCGMDFPDFRNQSGKTCISSDATKNTRPSNGHRIENINIANVTRELINFIMKMSTDEKTRLFKEKKFNLAFETPQGQHQNITKQLVDLIMNMSIDDRCRFLGELKTKEGITRRESAREGYVTPVYFAVKGFLQSGYTRNISTGGLLIETLKAMGRKFILGDPITINFEHPQERKEIKIHGRIVRVSNSAIAVCFDRQI
jgi:hypothetical protein